MTSKVNYKPEGYHTVTPYLIVNGAAKAIDFYKQAFGATEVLRIESPDGKIGHAEIKIGDSHIMLGDEMPEMGYSSPQSLGGTPVTMMLSVPEPLKVEGRGLRTQEQRDLFWKLLIDKFPQLKNGRVRIAKPNEIQYYWSTIPFDIEEPFFAIETPTEVFIANLRTSGGVTTLFWIDRVDDLRKLKN